MFPQRLKEARKAKKLTQEELAKLVTTKKTTISNYETGYSTPSNGMLIDLASVLGVSSDYLLGRTNSPEGFVFDASKATSPYELEKLIDENWYYLNADDVKLIEEHFKMIVKLAKERDK